MTPKIPESLKLEHEELHADLARATKAGGKTGKAAKAVAKVLHEHFIKGGGDCSAADWLVSVIGKRQSQSDDGERRGYDGPF